MPRTPEIGNVQLYPQRPLRDDERNGYVLKFYCPLRGQRIRRNCGTRDRREARAILRECRQRLLNGEYVDSGGAISIAQERATVRSRAAEVLATNPTAKGWDDCYNEYYAHRKKRSRPKSLADAASRVQIAQRILKGYREDRNLPADVPIDEYFTLETLEYLQDRLLSGDECRYDSRSPMTVNTTMGAVMAFVRYCKRHGWTREVPPLAKLDVDEVMKGRPISDEELERMIEAIPEVVGERSAESWTQVLRILWESAFRVGDVMNFSWDDERRIHPKWPSRKGDHPTLVVPSSQKNKKAQEIPMLPGLEEQLVQVPHRNRRGWVIDPLPPEYQIRSKAAWFKPTPQDLETLAENYSNSAIARACGVSETAVRKWLHGAGIQRSAEFDRHGGDIAAYRVAEIRQRAEKLLSHAARRSEGRLTKEHVGRIIAQFGERAGVVVQQADPERGRRLKYASAHDLRRGCAQRLINAGISAETLKIVLRHKDFRTTERFYGATRAAQAAAAEIRQRLLPDAGERALVGGLVGGNEQAPQLSAEELVKLKALLNSL